MPFLELLHVENGNPNFLISGYFGEIKNKLCIFEKDFLILKYFIKLYDN